MVSARAKEPSYNEYLSPVLKVFTYVLCYGLKFITEFAYEQNLTESSSNNLKYTPGEKSVLLRPHRH